MTPVAETLLRTGAGQAGGGAEGEEQHLLLLGQQRDVRRVPCSFTPDARCAPGPRSSCLAARSEFFSGGGRALRPTKGAAALALLLLRLCSDVAPGGPPVPPLVLLCGGHEVAHLVTSSCKEVTFTTTYWSHNVTGIRGSLRGYCSHAGSVPLSLIRSSWAAYLWAGASAIGWRAAGIRGCGLLLPSIERPAPAVSIRGPLSCTVVAGLAQRR